MILKLSDIGHIHLNKYEINNGDIVAMDTMAPIRVYYLSTRNWSTIIKNKIDRIY